MQSFASVVFFSKFLSICLLFALILQTPYLSRTRMCTLLVYTVRPLRSNGPLCRSYRSRTLWLSCKRDRNTFQHPCWHVFSCGSCVLSWMHPTQPKSWSLTQLDAALLTARRLWLHREWMLSGHGSLTCKVQQTWSCGSTKQFADKSFC